VARIDGDPSSVERRGEPKERLALADLGAPGALALWAKALQRLDRGRAGDAVGRKADVPLELAERAIGTAPQDAVLLPRVEPEEVQLGLERADVIATKRRVPEIDDAIGEVVPGLDQLVPRVLPDEPIHDQPAPLLKFAHGFLRARSEESVLVGIDPVAKGPQARLQVEDRAAAGTAVEDGHGDIVPGVRPGTRT
jgi:hypothetical protein